MERLLVTMQSMRNDIWAALCGDVGTVATAEAASKRNENALSETTGPITHGAGLQKTGRGNPNPHRCPQPLHCYAALGIPITEPVG